MQPFNIQKKAKESKHQAAVRKQTSSSSQYAPQLTAA
jgi:hypothetical protein